MKKNRILMLLLMVMVSSGCATSRKLVLEKTNVPISLSEESIALFTMTTDNWNAPKYPPKAQVAYINKIDGAKVKKFKLKVNRSIWDVYKDRPTDYLLSVQLPPGTYKIREILGISGMFPVIGHFIMPVYSEFTLKENEIAYIGHIEAIVHKRENKTELRAGPVIPLIDQSVTGFGGGTFKISITDDYIEDVEMFMKQYPDLEGFTINNRAMEDWVQPTKAELKSKK